MTDIRKMPAFPAKTLFDYLYRTSIEDYFCFLEQKVSRWSPQEYRILRQRICCILGVHKTESLRELMYAMHSKLNEVQKELDELYDEDVMYSGLPDAGNDSGKDDHSRRLKKKLNEWNSLYMYMYILLVQPFLCGLGDAGEWKEQMRQRLRGFREISEKQWKKAKS